MMPTDEKILGFSNRWYAGALQTAQMCPLANLFARLESPQTIPRTDIDEESGTSTQVIRLVTAPYFTATKLDAYTDRGNHDLYASHDLEDILSRIRQIAAIKL